MDIECVPNLGPVSAGWLRGAGITTGPNGRRSERSPPIWRSAGPVTPRR